jgi:myo-inositol-1(or 4)-monophosphatase
LPAGDPGPDRAELRDRLGTAVREAGALALQTFRGELKSWIKGASSPVSEADLAVDALLRERLLTIRDAGWLSEETEDDPARLQRADVWVVDPIDGTRAYLNGRTDWAISVALVEDGRPIAGAIFAPMEDGLYLAVASEGATRDGAPMAASAGGDFTRARVAGPKPIIEHFARSAAGIIAEPKVHSLALRMARTASGRLDIAFASADSHDWDLAAADLLVHEAGGALTRFDGAPLVYNSAEARHEALVAAGRARHARVVEIVREWRSGHDR